MAFPDDQLLNPWADGVKVDAVDMYDRITAMLNAVALRMPLIGSGTGVIAGGTNAVEDSIVFGTPLPYAPTTGFGNLSTHATIPLVLYLKDFTSTGFNFRMMTADGSNLPSTIGAHFNWVIYR